MDRFLPRFDWGMSRSELMSVEGTPSDVLADGSIVYFGELLGTAITTFFGFSDQGLKHIVIMPTVDNHREEVNFMFSAGQSFVSVFGSGEQFSVAANGSPSPRTQAEFIEGLLRGSIGHEHRWWSNDSLIRVTLNPNSSGQRVMILVNPSMNSDGNTNYIYPLAWMK